MKLINAIGIIVIKPIFPNLLIQNYWIKCYNRMDVRDLRESNCSLLMLIRLLNNPRGKHLLKAHRVIIRFTD
jgi:hypothetical protein